MSTPNYFLYNVSYYFKVRTQKMKNETVFKSYQGKYITGRLSL